MSVFANAWERLDKWLQKNASLITIASILVLVCIGWNVRSTYDDEQRVQRENCASTRERFLDVSRFWQQKATARGSHAAEERGASQLWNSIAAEMSTLKNKQLTADISAVASKWVLLADDDDAEAKINASYVDTLTRDYNRACGDAPTPPPSS